MTGRKITSWLAACVLTAAAATSGQAQDAFCGPACDFNSQMFSPVDYDFDCMPLRKDCGVFFNYQWLAWAYTGEKTTIGDRGRTVQSEIIFPQTNFSEGNAPPTYTINNSIQEALPNGDFGYGARYELGYFAGGAGWTIGVMDGPRVSNNEFFGFEQIEIPNTLPLDSQLDQFGNFEDPLPPLLAQPGAGSADLSTARNGFGSVFVNFETPPGFLLGFRDYWFGNSAFAVIGGPSRQLFIGEVEVETVFGVQDIDITEAGVFSGGDGFLFIVDPDDGTIGLAADSLFADDLDGDGSTFFFIFVDANGNGILDDDEAIIGSGADFDDLHQFNVAFDNLRVRNTVNSHSVELMRTHTVDNSWMFKKRQNNMLQLGYGVRFFNLDDNFSWEGKGGILGRTVVSSVAENQIIGPQIQAKWQSQHGNLRFGLDGRFVFGYNVQDINLDTNMGEDLVPGGVNSPIGAWPTTTSQSRQDNNFSPMAELRAEGSYQLTSALAIKLGYTAMFIDNITRGSQVVHYRLPDFGIRRGGNQEIFASGVDVGIEAVY